MKLLFKRYILNLILSFAAYMIIALSDCIISNQFDNLLNFSALLFCLFFIILRLFDDYVDFYKDVTKNKVLLKKNTILVLFICFSIAFITVAILSKNYFFIALLIFPIILYVLPKWYVSCWIAPIAIFLVYLSEFGVGLPCIIATSISFIISIIFAFSRKKETHSINEVGGKGFHLYEMNLKETPPFIVIPASVLFPYNKNLVTAYIKSFCKKSKKYAVRSSGIDEDGDYNSFAGVHDTFLYVGYNNIEENIIKVIKSATSEVALSYRKNNNIQTDNIKIAVVIQEMVNADFAGVINTINPVTNNTFETVISVCKGTGEKLVNGDVDGTNYYVSGNNVKVKGEDIVPREMLKKIMKLSNKVAIKTDKFQDIEFAAKGRKVYFLQTRAITTHKDINSKNLTMLIDNSNIIESYYGVVSPLTESFAKEIYEKVYKATFALAKAPKKVMNVLDNSFKNMLYCYEGKIYYNLFSWYHVNSVFPSKKSLSYMENMMGVKSSSNGYKKVKVNIFSLIKSMSIFLFKISQIIKLSDKFIYRFNDIVNPYYGKKLALSNEECFNLYNQISDSVVPEFTTPILNDTAVMFYYGSLKEKAKKYENCDEIIASAVNNNGQVESAASATGFEVILNFIRNNKSYKKDFEKLSTEKLIKKYYKTDDELSDLIDEYIYDYGSRVMNELKLETITMIEDPSILINLLKQSINSSDSIETKPQEIEIPKELNKVAKKAKKYIQNRERLRLRRTYIFSVVRNIFLNIGNNFAEEGRIDEPRDIFYLTREEIFESREDYHELVKERKAQREEYKKCEYYDRVAFYDDKPLPVLFSEGAGDLHGIPSGKGKITAKVSVLENSTDPFTPGNIILTKRTDPGWISLFPLASGLIVEHGSMLSHSFVVAREIGLPAVVGVVNATKCIKDGDTVTLDATKGEIAIEH